MNKFCENLIMGTFRLFYPAKYYGLEHIPEGTRNKKDDALQELKGGAAIFAVRTKSPIVPVMMLKRARLFRRTKLIFGEPFEFSEYYGKKLTEEDYRKLDAELREKMIALQSQLKALCAKKKGRNGNRTER